MTLVRHFTATAFVVHDDSVALHWHPKVKAWLPPGGHIEENEDPVQAALREVHEETGLRAEVVPTSEVIELSYPTQVLPPFTIMVEDIDDPGAGVPPPHRHDLLLPSRRDGSHSQRGLEMGVAWRVGGYGASLELDDGRAEAPPEDVRVLALHAFRVVADAQE